MAGASDSIGSMASGGSLSFRVSMLHRQPTSPWAIRARLVWVWWCILLLSSGGGFLGMAPHHHPHPSGGGGGGVIAAVSAQQEQPDISTMVPVPEDDAATNDEEEGKKAAAAAAATTTPSSSMMMMDFRVLTYNIRRSSPPPNVNTGSQEAAQLWSGPQDSAGGEWGSPTAVTRFLPSANLLVMKPPTSSFQIFYDVTTKNERSADPYRREGVVVGWDDLYPKDWMSRRDGIVKNIKKARAEVVALQECEKVQMEYIQSQMVTSRSNTSVYNASMPYGPTSLNRMLYLRQRWEMVAEGWLQISQEPHVHDDCQPPAQSYYGNETDIRCDSDLHGGAMFGRHVQWMLLRRRRRRRRRLDVVKGNASTADSSGRGRLVGFVNTHWTAARDKGDMEANTAQKLGRAVTAMAIADVRKAAVNAGSLEDVPVVVMGDFNAQLSNEAVSGLVADAELQDGWTAGCDRAGRTVLPPKGEDDEEASVNVNSREERGIAARAALARRWGRRRLRQEEVQEVCPPCGTHDQWDARQTRDRLAGATNCTVGARIDHVFVDSSRVQIQEAWQLGAFQRSPSDHVPFIARVRVNGSPVLTTASTTTTARSSTTTARPSTTSTTTTTTTTTAPSRSSWWRWG